MKTSAGDCTGCRLCENVCAFSHHGVFQPSLSRVKVSRRDMGQDKPVICKNCPKPRCVEACDVGAITVGSELGGYVLIDLTSCTGCGQCVKACPFDAIWLDDRGMPYKCDFCLGEVKCVKRCPTSALFWTGGEG
ncbi:MAG: 4Fe-4S dicluster domain-containing protein [Bacillota bacterium]|jgi:Fe-S-cluster-containing hydrogenase component 2